MTASINPNDEFALVFNNFLLQTNKVITFRNDVLFLIDNGKDRLLARADEKIQTLKNLTKTTEQKITVTPELEKIVSESLDAFQLVKNPDATIRHTKRRIDAAAIVFVHSLLDATVYSLCKISCLVSQKDWLPFIKERKIRIEDIMLQGADKFIQQAVEDYIINLERKSITERSDLLHSICKPKSKTKYPSNFNFSREDLESFDKLRHEIVHGEQAGREILNIENNLYFGLKAGVYFASIVRHKYGLQKEISEQQYEQLVAEN